jgi:RHS repeat-associated protein
VNDYFQFFGSIEGWDWEEGKGVTPNRYYPNYQGRWMSPDPLAGDISNPQSLNLYAYALNNPTSLTDPLGLQGCPGGSHSIGSGQCESNYTGGEEMWFPLSWLWDPFSLIDIPAKGFWFWNGEWGREDMGNGFSAAVAGGWLTKDDLATLPLPDLTNILRGLSPTACSGEATFSAVGPDQATGAGALAVFGILAHQRGGVAVDPAVFGLPLPGTLRGNTAVQRQLAGMSPFISIYPSGLNLWGGPSPGSPGPPYFITSIGDKNIRNSTIPRFDIFNFPSRGAADWFGKQTVPTLIVVSGGLPCPRGFSGGQ